MPVAATMISARGRRAPIPPAPPPSFNFDFFVSTTGGTGAGTIGDPWSLTYALSGGGGAIVPGKKRGIRGGTYDAGSGNWNFGSAVSGSVGTGVDNIDSKVVFMNYNGEHVNIINSSAGAADVIKVNCDYVWLWGLEIYDNG